MLTKIRTNSENIDFVKFSKELDLALAITDGAEHAFYAKFNKIDTIEYVIIAYLNGKAAACGAIKTYNNSHVEIKRMYTSPKYRKKGLAFYILDELESWARELAFEQCILETGVKQVEAIQLYLKAGYTEIANYGQYVGAENSRCFKKKLSV